MTGQVISPLSEIPRGTNFDLYVEKAEWFFTANHFHGALTYARKLPYVCGRQCPIYYHCCTNSLPIPEVSAEDFAELGHCVGLLYNYSSTTFSRVNETRKHLFVFFE